MIKKAIHSSELIGQVVEIVDSTNSHQVGFVGTIVDETKNTIRVMKEGKIKIFLKQNVTLKVGRDILLRSADIKKRPEDRIKG